MTQGLSIANADAFEQRMLSQLRAKTDRQIMKLLCSKLDEALRIAARDEPSEEAMELSRARAEQALSEARRLAPALNDEMGQELDRKLRQVRNALQHLSHRRESRPRSAAVGG